MSQNGGAYRGAMSKDKTKKTKYILDVSARFYPIISGKKRQSLFGLVARLCDEIDGVRLEVAVNDAARRFPTICARIVGGYSWHYVRPNDSRIKVFEDDGAVLKPIDINETNGYMFRLSYGGRIVKLDIFHALTDANGGLEFLKAVLRRYRELEGVCFDESCGIANCSDQASEAETEDSFVRYYKPIPLSKLGLKEMVGFAPHRRKGTFNEGGRLKREVRAFDAQVALDIAKLHEASLTAYFTGVLAYCLEKLSDNGKPYVLMIPVNLRRIFPSRTHRNFVTFVRVVIYPKKHKTLEEYIASAKEQLSKLATRENMEKFISTTVRGTNNALLKSVPLAIKTFFIRLGRLFMRSRQTIIFSNVGKIDLPDMLGVEQMWLQPNVSKNNVENMACITVGNVATLAFTRIIEEDSLSKLFFDTLVEQGLTELDEYEA